MVWDKQARNGKKCGRWKYRSRESAAHHQARFIISYVTLPVTFEELQGNLRLSWPSQIVLGEVKSEHHRQPTIY